MVPLDHTGKAETEGILDPRQPRGTTGIALTLLNGDGLTSVCRGMIVTLRKLQGK